jgi:DNA-binding phage protein
MQQAMAMKSYKATKDYKEYLRETLADPEEAAAYLNAALEEGDESVFLLALRDVAEAHGIAKLAEQANSTEKAPIKCSPNKVILGFRVCGHYWIQ